MLQFKILYKLNLKLTAFLMGVVDTEKSQISLGPHRKIDIVKRHISGPIVSGW